MQTYAFTLAFLLLSGSATARLEPESAPRLQQGTSQPQDPPPSGQQVSPPPVSAPVIHHVSGSFEVKATRLPVGDSTINRTLLEKTFHGGLEATSKGEMLAELGSEKGSAGYVAMERVTGRLDGKSGTFVLMHSGTLDRGTPTMSVAVVPDSGTGELTTLAGKMTIQVSGADHGYIFDYTL